LYFPIHLCCSCPKSADDTAVSLLAGFTKVNNHVCFKFILTHSTDAHKLMYRLMLNFMTYIAHTHTPKLSLLVTLKNSLICIVEQNVNTHTLKNSIIKPHWKICKEPQVLTSFLHHSIIRPSTDPPDDEDYVTWTFVCESPCFFNSA